MGGKALNPTHWTGAGAKVTVSPQEAGFRTQNGQVTRYGWDRSQEANASEAVALAFG